MCSILSSPWSLMFFLKLKTLFFLKLRLSTTDIKTMRPERADRALKCLIRPSPKRLPPGSSPVSTLAAGRAAIPSRPHPPFRPRFVWMVERLSAKFGSKYFPKRQAKKSPRCFLRHGNEPRLDLKHSYDGRSRGAPGAREPGSPTSCGVRPGPPAFPGFAPTPARTGGASKAGHQRGGSAFTTWGIMNHN